MTATFRSRKTVSMISLALVPQGRERQGDELRGERGPAVPEREGPGVDLGGPVDQQRHDDAGDHQEDDFGRAGVRSVEAATALLAGGRLLDADDGERG